MANAPYHRLRPGLLSPLWKQIRPYVHHRGLFYISTALKEDLMCCYALNSTVVVTVLMHNAHATFTTGTLFL